MIHPSFILSWFFIISNHILRFFFSFFFRHVSSFSMDSSNFIMFDQTLFSSYLISYHTVHTSSSCFLMLRHYLFFHDFPFFSTSAIILTHFHQSSSCFIIFDQQVSFCFNCLSHFVQVFPHFCFLTVSALRRVPRRLCHHRYHIQGFPTDSCHARNIALKLRRFFLTRLIEDFLQLQRAPHKNTCTQTSANAAPIPPNVCGKNIRRNGRGIGRCLRACVFVWSPLKLEKIFDQPGQKEASEFDGESGLEDLRMRDAVSQRSQRVAHHALNHVWSA